MKILFLTIGLLSILYSDDIQRIELIVKDISELRGKYEKCNEELKEKSIQCEKSQERVNKYKKLYNDEKRKRLLLETQIDNNADKKKSNRYLLKRINKLEKLLKNREKLLKAKENSNENQRKKSIVTTDGASLATLFKQKCEETDGFPKLMMKKQYQIESLDESKIIKFKAAPFRLKTESVIYDNINGNKIAQWERGTSFTSNKKTRSWIQITGYFVDKKWRSAKKEMWVKQAQVSKR